MSERTAEDGLETGRVVKPAPVLGVAVASDDPPEHEASFLVLACHYETPLRTRRGRYGTPRA